MRVPFAPSNEIIFLSCYKSFSSELKMYKVSLYRYTMLLGLHCKTLSSCRNGDESIKEVLINMTFSKGCLEISWPLKARYQYHWKYKGNCGKIQLFLTIHCLWNFCKTRRELIYNLLSNKGTLTLKRSLGLLWSIALLFI